MNACRFSPCRRYRYSLEHVIDPMTFGAIKRVMWIGLNPSTADEQQLDPTLRRIRAFTLREGGASFVMTNLFAWRDTDPRGMKAAEDPVGPENDEVLRQEAEVSHLIVCAWGTHGSYRGRAAAVIELLKHRPLFCLSLNSDGSPVHPLYVPGWRSLQRMPTP